jgi:hypothetical protein
MQGFFSEQTRIVTIDEENTVTIRKLSYGARQKAIGLVTKVNPITQESTMDIALLLVEQLVAAIVDWAGPGFEGRPVSRENVEALPTVVAEAIEAGIEAFNAPLSSAEKKA